MSFGTVAKIYVSECIFSALKKRWFRDGCEDEESARR